MNESIFEVSRAEYKDFIETIKPEYRQIETVDLDRWHQATKIFSKKTGKCLTSRVTYTGKSKEDYEPEKYYIFEIPDDEERCAVIPKVKIVLETKEQVQAFLDGMKKIKEQTND